MDHQATIYTWADNTIVYQALSKLTGTAQIWYEGIVRNEVGWSQYSWNFWKELLLKTFRTSRNMHKLLSDLLCHKPQPGDSLYEYHFKHLSVIDNLQLNFTEKDKVSLIVGGIGDSNLASSIEAANITKLSVLSNYLKTKVCPQSTEPVNPEPVANTSKQNTFLRKPINRSRHQLPKICYCCGKSNHQRKDCHYKNKICNFCHKEGHIESACRRKAFIQNRSHSGSIEQSKPKQVNLLESVKNRFQKTVLINDISCHGFIDLGSDCSLITRKLATKLGLIIQPLQKDVNLAGFLGNGTTVTEFVEANLTIENA